MTEAGNKAQPVRKCVICGKPQDERLRPFCSKRCADVDLARWMTGAYAIPAEEKVPDAIKDEE